MEKTGPRRTTACDGMTETCQSHTESDGQEGASDLPEFEGGKDDRLDGPLTTQVVVHYAPE